MGCRFPGHTIFEDLQALQCWAIPTGEKSWDQEWPPIFKLKSPHANDPPFLSVAW